MSKEYLNDIPFLTALDEMRIKEHFIKLQVMNFKEEPLREIQGIATAGNITVNGTSAVRRTLSLTIVAPLNENNINNIDNIISANKKIKVEIGLKNPFATYVHYGDIIWFPLGTYLVTEATASTTATSATISLKGKDKMCLLDGTCGGTLPATVIFHETQVQDNDNNIKIEKIPIFTIIKECVRHYGKELEQNIIINDIDLVAKQSVQYIGATPIWFPENYYSFIIDENAPSNEEFLAHKFICDQDIGYLETDFTFPGELVFEAGSTVVEVLDKIVQTIGNYEYFYDLDGRFVFQQKKNYLNNYYTPITDLNDYYYIKAFSDSKYYKTLQNARDSISYYDSPKYDNLKNDFVVWGSRTDANGNTKNLKYHVAIDEKPLGELASQWMWEVKNGKNEHLYYFFDSGNKDYINVPEPTPIDLFYDSIEESELEDNIRLFLEENYVNYTSTESQFVLYLHVQWRNEIRYYKATISNQILKDLEYLSMYTDYIKQENIVFGLADKIVKNSEVENDGEETPIIPLPDGGGQIEGSDDNIKLINKEPSDEEEIIDEFYSLLELVYKNNNPLKPYELGYYKNNEWINLFELENKQLTPQILKEIISKIQKNFGKNSLRIFITDTFLDEFNNLTSIENTNLLSSYELNSIDPQDLRYYKNNQIVSDMIQFIYPFSDIKDKNDKIILEKEEWIFLLTQLTELYKKDEKTLKTELSLLINEILTSEDYTNLLPWLDTIKPDMPNDNKYSENIPIDKDENTTNESINFSLINEAIGTLIQKYYEGIKEEDKDLFDFLLNEINNYINNYKINFNTVPEDFIISIITYKPELKTDFDYEDNFYYTLIGKSCSEWREDLYRQALLNKENANEQGYYDEELLAFWRQNFDTLNTEWQKEWEEKFSTPWEGWNPVIYTDPGLLNFWLDFIDSEQLITKYSVNQIGRRTIAVTKDSIKYLYKLAVPDVIFLENTGDSQVLQKIEEYQLLGQQYCAIKPSQMKYFSSSSIGNTAFDLIREMLYKHLYYNISVTINCIPKYYLGINNLIYINDERSNIYGDFIISQYTLPLTYNGNMSITTNQTMTRI